MFRGVEVLTWDQKSEWSDFANTIVNSGIHNLIAIKIADKLDNNRAIALSGNAEEKLNARRKTVETVLPIVERYYPKMQGSYNEVLKRLM